MSGPIRHWRSGAVAVVVLALAGCANPFAPEGTDVGVYKGAPDPLYEQPAEERDEALRERFELIQSR